MKTLEAFKNQCNAITKQIQQIGLDKESHFVIDGIIEPEKYLNAKYRILWISVVRDLQSRTILL